MNVFVDTNILIDLIADRKPFSKYAIELFSAIEDGQTKLFTSSHSIATAYYLLNKFNDDKRLREILSQLLEIVHVLSVDLEIIKKSLRSEIKDFEDAIQVLCCLTHGDIDCIVTRNKKDFKKSLIPVYSPDEIIEII